MSLRGLVDLGPIRRGADRIDYGLLLLRLFNQLIQKFTQLPEPGKVVAASRDEPTWSAWRTAFTLQRYWILNSRGFDGVRCKGLIAKHQSQIITTSNRPETNDE